MSGGPFVAQPYDAADPDVKVSDMQAALNPIVAILLSNCDSITADEITETLVQADDTSTDILGPGL